MTLSRNSLRSGLYVGIGATFLAMIGMVTALAGRYIITDVLTLGDTILYGLFLGAGVLAASRTGSRRWGDLLANGTLAAVIAVAILVSAVLLATQLNQAATGIGMETIFPNVTDALLQKLTFTQESALAGYILLALAAALLGALGSLVPILPVRVRRIGITTIMLVLVLGVLQDQINRIFALVDALWITLLVAAGYASAVWRHQRRLEARLLLPIGIGAVLGLGLALAFSALGANESRLPPVLGTPSPAILGFFFVGRSLALTLALFAVVGATLGAAGAALSSTSRGIHRVGVTIVAALLMLGILSSFGRITLPAALLISLVIAASQALAERTAGQAESVYAALNRAEKRTSRLTIGLVGLLFALVIPHLLSGYINNVVDLIGLYVMMGLGLNIVVGFAGLLDLGYVAFFTIGAYTVGILTTPNVITCPVPADNVVITQQATVQDTGFTFLQGQPVGVVSGTRAAYAATALPRPTLVTFDTLDEAVNALQAGEVVAVVESQAALQPYLNDGRFAASPPFRPRDDQWPARSFNAREQAAWCHTLTFWTAWPIAVLASGLAGVLLGIPVLRLRGDYLAIVTLGFGEIIRLIALSDLGKPYFGGAQGIIAIPSPVIDLTGLAQTLVNTDLPILKSLGQAFARPIALSQPHEIYYLILGGVLITAFVSYRLAHSRLGRAWRAMKEDEAVAQAVGVNLVRTKLLAFSIGAAFSGIGGAIFGAYIKSIFPNSFTLLVSINVLSLIIIGGMGNIPGVMIGALVIFGLPEALREFQDYRLLMFGALLVIMMLLRPEGIIPPTPARLEEEAQRAAAEEGA
ncbi:MAG: transporter substrate-binding domain-containing protein [Anaerolineae bacterium]|nr:transporter substrate-binding domain-containing protein [Anaerolineae bacterium]